MAKVHKQTAVLSWLVTVLVALRAFGPGVRTAELSYFSLTTITTTGYGDLAPVHQLARSMANMEAVFGQIFPATFVARLVALHLAHGEEKKRRSSE